MDDSTDDSTEGNGSWGERGRGGVRAFWRGEALYVSKWPTADAKGGSEARLMIDGERGIYCDQIYREVTKRERFPYRGEITV